MMVIKDHPGKKSSASRVDDDGYGGTKQHHKPHSGSSCFLS